MARKWNNLSMFSQSFEKIAISGALFGKAVSSAIGRSGAANTAQRLAQKTQQHASQGRVRTLAKRKGALKQNLQPTLNYNKLRAEHKAQTPPNYMKNKPAAPSFSQPADAATRPQGRKVPGQQHRVRQTPYVEISNRV